MSRSRQGLRGAGDGSALPSWLVATRDAQTGEIVFTATPGAGMADTDLVVKLTAFETANAAKTVSTTFTVKVRANNAPVALQVGTDADVLAASGLSASARAG